MAALGVPEAAQQRLRQLQVSYLVSKRDLFLFTEGLLLGMGLSPDDWELDTATMRLHRQKAPVEVYANGIEN